MSAAGPRTEADPRADTARERSWTARLLAGYRRLPGVPDEMVTAEGTVRPGWDRLLGAFARLGAEALTRGFGAADRHLQESGVFYRVYDDPTGGERQWPLAPVPLVIGAAEWRQLEAAVIQRARLGEAILADAYGDGDLVRDGVLPAALIAGSPEFLRPLVGIAPPGGRFLRMHAVDLGRGPDGEWWVLSDRAQAPSGAGYALENRIALSRALPDVYRALNVERLAGFFQAWRAELAGLNRSAEARVSLLTPGRLNETYFEHAYLARYLGFLLVEGGDLTVRDDAVHVRTVAGLRRVDVLWRRLDSDYADPLELRADSRLGVPGLVQAVRAGNLVVANALGSGLLESRALMAFMPALARRLLGEDLLLPNVATWWCGAENARAEVLRGLDKMVIAPAFGAATAALPGGPVIGAGLTPTERRDLVAAMARRGVDFVGQEAVRLSSMPVWTGAGLAPRPFSLRLFVVATADGWTVMPGGFCRIAADEDPRAVTLQRGASSADVWVLGDRPVEKTTLLPRPEAVLVRRASGTLPSRAADNLFWLGRYMERAEATLRLVRALTGRLVEGAGTEAPLAARIVDILAAGGAVADPAATPIHLGQHGGAVLSRTDLPGAIPRLAGSARFAASAIRDRLSPDAWETVDAFADLFQAPARRLGESEAFDLTAAGLRLVAAFYGLASENMNRLTGWRFLELGRRIERGAATCRFVRALTAADAPPGALDAALELGDSQITYRVRYVMTAARAPVIDLLLLDPDNPRSAAFQLGRIEQHLAVLPGAMEAGRPAEADRIASGAATRLRVALAEEGGETLAADTERDLLAVSDAIARRYFTERQAAAQGWDGLA